MIKIAKKHPLYDPLRWVALARNTDMTSRPILSHIKVEPARFLATDGHRLHMYTPAPADDHGMAAGLYEVVKVTRSEIVLVLTDEAPGAYPNYQRVIPDTADFKLVIETTSRAPGMVINNLFCKVVKAAPDNLGYTYGYFKDFVNTGSAADILIENKPGVKGLYNNGRLALKTLKHFGILMPLLVEVEK